MFRSWMMTSCKWDLLPTVHELMVREISRTGDLTYERQRVGGWVDGWTILYWIVPPWVEPLNINGMGPAGVELCLSVQLLNSDSMSASVATGLLPHTPQQSSPGWAVFTWINVKGTLNYVHLPHSSSVTPLFLLLLLLWWHMHTCM